jgi:hypothetical protein
MAKSNAGSVFVARIDEVEPLIQYSAGSISIGDAVRHREEGPCTVLARLGDHLMIEAELTPEYRFSSDSRSG